MRCSSKPSRASTSVVCWPSSGGARSNTSWMTQPGSPRTLFNYLGPLMASHYQRIGGFFFDGPTGHWTEPLPDQDLTRSSLVLFKRRGN